jgi:hypothetical protein
MRQSSAPGRHVAHERGGLVDQRPLVRLQILAAHMLEDRRKGSATPLPAGISSNTARPQKGT